MNTLLAAAAPHAATFVILSTLTLLIWLAAGISRRHVLWWVAFTIVVLDVLWLRYLAWRERWPGRVRKAFREWPGQGD